MKRNKPFSSMILSITLYHFGKFPAGNIPVKLRSYNGIIPIRLHLRAVSVVEKAFGGVWTGIGDTFLGDLLDAVAYFAGFESFKGHQCSTNASNMGGSHGCARHLLALSVQANGCDLIARCIHGN